MMWMYLVLVFSWLGWQSIAMGQTKSVAVLMAFDHEAISVPTVELYRRILDDVRDSSQFLVIPMSVAREHFDAKIPPNLGALPAFDRRYLLKAHPPARKYHASAPRHTTSTKRVIRPVQSLVDTLAIDGALLLDCQTSQKGALLKGCGLYYYDRARGQVVGSVTKPFQVGIRDARRWSSILIADLGNGISAEKQSREKKSIQRALAQVNPEQNNHQFLVEIAAGGHSAAEKGVVYSPSVSLMAGQKFDGFVMGLVGSGGESSRTVGDRSMKFLERSIGVGFSVGSSALLDMEWDLGLSLAISNRQLTNESSSSMAAQTSLLQSRRDLKLTVQPGLLWNLTSNTAWGASFLASRYFGVSQTQSEATVDGLQSSGVGMSIRLRTLF